jgi:biopolymer transport protein TolR
MQTLSRLNKRHRPIAEINLIPYIDVMLVLLIIFMVTAPMLSQGVHVSLPEANAHNLSQKSDPPIIVSVNRQGSYFLNTTNNPGASVTAEELVSQVSSVLEAAKQHNQHRDVYVKGDQAVDYGKVVQAMVLLQKAGAKQVGLITAPLQDQSQPPNSP